MFFKAGRGAKDDQGNIGITQSISEWLSPSQEVTGPQPGPVSMILSGASWISNERVSVLVPIDLDVFA